MLTDSLKLQLFATVALVASGCSLFADDELLPPRQLSDKGADAGAPAATTVPAALSPLRRLTAFEYENTVHDLLGEDPAVSLGLASDSQPDGFDTLAIAQMFSREHADKFMVAAETLADRVVAKIATLAPCDVAITGEEACARTIAATFGRRVYRRPLLDAERDRLVALYKEGRGGGGDGVDPHAEGLRWMIQGMLQAPQFLYRVEEGIPIESETRFAAVEPYALASRLSYLFWGTMPDEPLFAAAQSGGLGSEDGLRTEARRLMADPRARRGVAHFHEQWLETASRLDTAVRDPGVYPRFDAVRDDLKTELATFLDQTFFGGGSLDALLTSPDTYVNANLASWYGLPAPNSSGFVKVAAGEQRSGVLTQGAFLSAFAHPDQTSPVLRGKFVYQRLLCGTLGDPPANAPASPPAVDPNATTRERMDQLTGPSQPGCWSCHRKVNPLGFAFENFDSGGRFRALDGNARVDSSGVLDGTAVTFAGPVDLARTLAQDERVRACVVKQWFRYASGRFEAADNEESLVVLQKKFAEAKYDLRALVVELATTPSFRFRVLP